VIFVYGILYISAKSIDPKKLDEKQYVQSKKNLRYTVIILFHYLYTLFQWQTSKKN
jgi:hypothetical protein